MLVSPQILSQLTYNLISTISLSVDAAWRHGQDIEFPFKVIA